MKKFKGLIFDFNGVLLLDQHLHDAIWVEVAKDITGKTPTKEEIKNTFQGSTNRILLEHLLGRPLSDEELNERMLKKELEYQRVARTIDPAEYTFAPGATRLLEDLRKRAIPYTIATSSPMMNIDFFDEMLGLREWFDMKKIVYDDGTVRGKPAPDLYLKAAQVLALQPADCVVIEDARSGIAAAHAAGIGYIIAIGPKDTHETLRKMEGVSEVIERLSEVDTSRLF